jgi:hypothetical protein
MLRISQRKRVWIGFVWLGVEPSGKLLQTPSCSVKRAEFLENAISLTLRALLYRLSSVGRVMMPEFLDKFLTNSTISQSQQVHRP